MKAEEWEFFKYQAGEDRTDSSSDKHFKNLDINTSLVRELIQNSLDAVQDKDLPVNLNIEFKKLKYKEFSKYLEGLEKHYKACDKNNFPDKNNFNFLILEDFNTTGLKDIKNFFEKDNIKNDKDDSSGGSHGIGKAIFHVASQIKTFFAFSISDNEKVFRGKSSLKTHKIGEEEYKQYGHLTLEDTNSVIKNLFKREEQKGLSIAIPFIRSELAEEKLRQAIIDEYYYPIIKGKLTVNISNKEINEDTIVDEDDDNKAMLISDYITQSEFVEIDIEYNYKNTEFKLENDKKIKKIIKDFAEDKGTFIKFNFILSKKGKSQGEKGYLHLLVSKKGEEKDEKFDFWRESLLIKEASKRKRSSSQYTVIIIIEDNKLSTLLKALENPSHTQWEYQNLNYDIEYTNIKKLVPFITQLPNKLLSLLKTQNIELDNNFFSGYFPDKSSSGNKSSKGTSFGKTIKPEVSFPSRNPNFEFRVNREDNGFILSLSEKGKQEKIEEISITIAYGDGTNNPFKSYDKRDFDFSKKDITIKVKNGKQLIKDGNNITCQVNGKDFKISLSGFDSNRELKIDIKEN